MAKKMLITGGAGFIGVNAARYFASQGWEVTVFDNLSRKGTAYNLQALQQDVPAVRFIQGDVRHLAEVQAALTDGCDVILHLAGQVAVTTSVVNPREDFEMNALGSFTVLEAARLASPQPIVLYSSTNKVYGGLEDLEVTEGEKRYAFRNHPLGVSEKQPLDFHSPYGCSKGAADQYVRDYARIYGLKTVVLRQSCIYGPHQMGIEDQGWVAWFMIAGLFGRPITVYGNGKQVRDLLYVDDLIRAYDAAIQNIDCTAGQVYNMGGGAENTLSLLEFLDFLKNDLGLAMPYATAAERPGDQPIFVSDNSLALRDFGWQPTMNVQDGIRKLHSWLKEHRDQLSRFYAS